MIIFDTETDLITPEQQFPRIVCVQWARVENGRIEEFHLVDEAEGLKVLAWALDSGQQIAGAETAFDVGVSCTSAEITAGAGEAFLSAWVAAYDQDRVSDIFNRQKLLDLAAGCLGGYVNAKGKYVEYGYNLGALSKRHLGWDLEKDGGWRLRYGELRGIPVHAWPSEARQYAITDVLATGEVWLKQEQQRFTHPEIQARFGNLDPFADEFRQARSALWLKYMSAHGLRTNRQKVEEFSSHVIAEYQRVANHLADNGLVVREYNKHNDRIVEYARKQNLLQYVTKPGNPPSLSLTAGRLRESGDPVLSWIASWRDVKAGCLAGDARMLEGFNYLQSLGLVSMKFKRSTKAASRRMVAVCSNKGREAEYTDAGNVCLNRAECDKSGDPLLQAYGELSSLSKTQSTDVPILREGSRVRIHTRFENILATGRTSSSSPNVQNVRRLVGIRECFEPPPGWVYIDADFPALELHTLAQACIWLFGFSRLAEVLNAGGDPHSTVGADMLGISYEEFRRRYEAGDPEADNIRNAAKPRNFGIPGGLGWRTLIDYALLGYKVVIPEDAAKRAKPEFMQTWPEMRPYFDYVAGLESFPQSGEYNCVQPYSNRLRGDGTYCAICNTNFQGLGADVAKLAGWLIFKACYIDRSDPLFGSRPVNFPHDQFIIETPLNGNEHEAAESCARHMSRASEIVLPDCPMKVKALLCRYWSKEAKRKTDANGKLIPWPA